MGDDSQHRRRVRKPSVTAAIKQALRAGVTVAGATVKPDGSISLTFAQGAEPSAVGDANEWDAQYGQNTEVH